MNKKIFKINELEPGKLYDMVNNPYPDHILYFVDDEGFFWNKDLIVKTQSKSIDRYNDTINLEFYEVSEK